MLNEVVDLWKVEHTLESGGEDCVTPHRPVTSYSQLHWARQR